MLFAGRLLLLWGWGAVAQAASLAIRTCSSSAPDECCAPDASDWMRNGAEQNPCQLLEQLMRVCQPEYSLSFIPAAMSCPAASPCCCSTVTYTLFAACRLCQSETTPRTSYYEFLTACGPQARLGALPSIIGETAAATNLSVPQWATIVPDAYSDAWDWEVAMLNATQTLPPSPSSSASTPADSPQPTTRGHLTPAALAGTLVAIILLVIAGAVYSVHVKRRRRRIRRASSVPELDNQRPRRLVDLSEQLDAPSMRDPGAPIVPWGEAHRLPRHPPPARPKNHHHPPRRASATTSVSRDGVGRPLPPSAQYLLSVGRRPPLFSDRAVR